MQFLGIATLFLALALSGAEPAAAAGWTCTMSGTVYEVNLGCIHDPQQIWDASCFEIWEPSRPYHNCTIHPKPSLHGSSATTGPGSENEGGGQSNVTFTVPGKLSGSQERARAKARATELRRLMSKLRTQQVAAKTEFKIQKRHRSLGLTSSIVSSGATLPTEAGETQKIDRPDFGGKDKEFGEGTYSGKVNRNGGGGSDISGTDSKIPDSSVKGAPIDNPWVAYMSDTVRTRMVEEMRKSPALRDELRKKIAAMSSTNPEEKETKQMLSMVLAEAEKAASEKRLSDDMSPLSAEEAFSMGADETNKAIREMMAQLEDNKFEASLQQPESLFERVSRTHKRCLKAGCLGWWKKK